MIEGIFFFLGIGFVVSFLGYIAFFILSIAFDGFRGMIDSYLLRFGGAIDGKLKSKYEIWFVGKFSYYDRLPEHMKIKFLIRVRRFVRSKEYIGRENLEVTDEMKIMIAASAIQLTLGLEKYTLDHFEKILIYPEKFLSTVTGEYHIGEANTKGILVISWADFKKGYAFKDDTYNVGLHEMAHALDLEKRLGDDADEFFTMYYPTWNYFAKEEFEKMQDENHSSFLRSYAATNQQEFFAVCVEHFFEASKSFRENLPQLYSHLCILLNQDPLQPDFKIQSIKIEKAIWTEEELALQTPELQFSSFPFSNPELLLRHGFFFLIGIWFLIQLNDIAIQVIAAVLIVSYIVLRIWMVASVVSLYKDVLVIKKIFRKKVFQYPIEKILQFNIEKGDYSSGELQLILANEGRIVRYEHGFQVSQEEEQKLLSSLKKYREELIQKS